MKEYFYSNGTDQKGPFSLEKLKECKITKETLIWFEGAKDWQKAGEIEEFKGLFKELATTTTVKPKKAIPKPISSSANQGKHPQTANIETVNKSEVITQLGDEEKNLNKKALPNSTTILFLGIFSILTCCCYGLPGLIFSIIAVIMSKKATAIYNENKDLYTESSFKTMNAGKICGIIGLCFSSLYFIYLIFLLIAGGVSAISDLNNLDQFNY